MWWLFTKKVQKHGSIRVGETVYQACYGLGGRIVQVANRAVSPVSETWKVPETDDGLASPINRSGVVALTNQRLLFFAKRFAIGNVKELTAEWPLKLIGNISYDDDTLAIAFVDDSVASLHVPTNQSPNKLVSALSDFRDKPSG